MCHGLQYARHSPQQYIVPFGEPGTHFSIVLKGVASQWVQISRKEMQEHLTDFKDQLLLYIYSDKPEEMDKNFEFYFNLDPFIEEDGVETKYATFE